MNAEQHADEMLILLDEVENTPRQTQSGGGTRSNRLAGGFRCVHTCRRK